MTEWIYVRKWQPFKRKWLAFIACLFFGHTTFVANMAEKHCIKCKKVWTRKGLFKNERK